MASASSNVTTRLSISSFGFAGRVAGREIAGDEDVHHFVHDAGRREVAGQLFELAGAVAGFFGQFAAGRFERRLVWLASAGRHFDQPFVHGDAAALNQADVVVVDQRQNRHRAAVLDVSDAGRAAVGAGDRLFDDVEAAGVEQGKRGRQGEGERGRFVGRLFFSPLPLSPSPPLDSRQRSRS